MIFELLIGTECAMVLLVPSFGHLLDFVFDGSRDHKSLGLPGLVRCLHNDGAVVVELTLVSGDALGARSMGTPPD